jgi:hypothetical protein
MSNYKDVLCVRSPLYPTGVKQLPTILCYNDDLLDVTVLRVPGLMHVPPLSFAQESVTIGESVISVGYYDPDSFYTDVTFLRLPTLSPELVRYVFLDYCCL